jgi:uncharacterized protein YggE
MKMTERKITLFLTVAAITLLSADAVAQERLEKQVPSISVTGEAKVTVKPDQALIDIGVLTQAETAQAAAALNAKQLDAVLAELRKLLGQSANIKTISYSLSRYYRYPKEGGKPEISGYTATNIVQVTTSDLTEVGKVIDAATQSGANQIQHLQFTLKDEQAIQLRALREATAEAQAKAEVLAQSLGAKILRVISAGESGSRVQPNRDFVLSGHAGSAQAPTPVEPGTIEVRATVRLTVEIGPR